LQQTPHQQELILPDIHRALHLLSLHFLMKDG
jgi:hypothetical protein